MKPAAPGLLSHIFAFVIYFFLAFIFRSVKPKIQKYFAALYFICDLFIQSITTFFHPRTNFWCRYTKGIDNPFNTSGREWFLFVCRCCLCCVAWFSYVATRPQTVCAAVHQCHPWISNADTHSTNGGFITE